MVAISTLILRLSNCCIFCTTSTVHLAHLARSVNLNKKNIVTLDIINPETENKHKIPNQNQISLNSKPQKSLNSLNPKTHSKEHQTAFPKKTELVNQKPIQNQ